MDRNAGMEGLAAANKGQLGATGLAWDVHCWCQAARAGGSTSDKERSLQMVTTKFTLAQKRNRLLGRALAIA